MVADNRTLTLKLSATLATIKGRYAISGATYRSAFQSTSHTVVETDIAANTTITLPAQTKFVMIGSEDSGVNLILTKTTNVVTLALDQVAVLPGAFAATSTDRVQVQNTSTTTAVTVRYLLM